MAPPPGPPPPNQPVYGQHPPYGDTYYQQNAPPQYTANPQNYGYFGAQQPPQQQQQGIELQQPANAYTPQGQGSYGPPPGPPPPNASKV
jgi:hypothetical protein